MCKLNVQTKMYALFFFCRTCMLSSFSLPTKNTHKGIQWHWEGWRNRTMAEWHDMKKIYKLLFRPTFLALRFIHVFLHCGRLQFLCLYVLWSCLKPLASSQHSMRLCVYAAGCVCECFFFPPCRWWRLREVPVSTLLSFLTLPIWVSLYPSVALVFYTNISLNNVCMKK